MIFSLFSRVAVKLGDTERHVFDRARLMYSEVAEIEKVTGLSYGEWERELSRYSITAVAALLHILRKRDGQPSDFKTMQFNAADLDVAPLRDDDTEMTADDIAADLARRQKEAEPDPTPAAAVPAGDPPPTLVTSGTSPVSPNGTASARGNGTASRGVTSAPSKRTPTPA